MICCNALLEYCGIGALLFYGIAALYLYNNGIMVYYCKGERTSDKNGAGGERVPWAWLAHRFCVSLKKENEVV